MNFRQWEQMVWKHTCDFIKSGKPNAWLEANPYGEIYVRNSQRFNLSGVNCLDRVFEIANVGLLDEYQGRGWFKRYLTLLGGAIRTDSLPIQDIVVIESVLNPDLVMHLNSRGWLLVPNHPETFYLTRAQIKEAYKDIILPKELQA